MDENEIFALIKKANDDSQTTIAVNPTDTALIQNNTEIRQVDPVDEYVPLTIQLPNNAQESWLNGDTEFLGSVVFMTGATVGTVNIPTTVTSGVDDFIIVYKGEDVISSTVNGKTVYTFEPTANKVYTFMFYWDSFFMVCEVTGYEIP